MRMTMIGALGLAALAAAAPALAGKVGSPADGMTLAQFQQKSRAHMLKGDSDGDGRISAAEWSAAARGRRAGGDPARSFARIDTNKDGFVDAAEIDGLTARRFTRLDANSDGTVTADEREAARKGRAD